MVDNANEKTLVPSDGPDPAKPAALTTDNKDKPSPAQFKVAEVRDDGDVVLELGDGRVFLATVKDGVEGVKKHATVTVKVEELDKHDVPVGAVIQKVVEKK